MVFFANIISNSIYLFARSCSNNRIYLKSTDTKMINSTEDDTLEEQQSLISVFNSYIVPFIVTVCLINSEWDDYKNIHYSVKS